MARSDKDAAVADIADAFRGSSAAVLTEYRGLTVSQLTELRRSMGDSARYAIVKNTLTKIAAKQAGLDGLDEMLTGPTAVAFISGDPVEAAKGLRDFSRGNPLLIIKGGVLDGNPISADEIRRLADLESREVLLAKLAGAMNASLQNAVSLFAAPLSQAARLVEALRQQREADGPAEATVEAPAEAPAAEAAADVAPEPATDSAEAAPAAVDAATDPTPATEED
jgi:large subunit ribosomal protein L10